MSSYYIYHHQYIVSKISNRHNKDKHRRPTPNHSVKSKTPKVINEVSSKQLTKAKKTSHAHRLSIHTDKEGGQPVCL